MMSHSGTEAGARKQNGATAMTNLLDPRTFDDEALDAAYEMAFRLPDVLRGTTEADTAVGRWVNKVKQEAMRRAEIRLSRGTAVEFGPNPHGFTFGDIDAKHDASWYDSRQTEAQFLAEMGVAE